MEMHLQPLATACAVSGEPFVEGARVASFLVRTPSMEIVRYDILEPNAGSFAPEGFLACSWVHVFKPRKPGDTTEKDLKLTAETLFTTLADPLTEQTEESVRLLQFLALMLERKKLLKPKGRTVDRERNVYEHAKTKQLFEVPVGELTPEFFIAVQEQLSVLVGSPKPKVLAGTEAAAKGAAVAGKPAEAGAVATASAPVETEAPAAENKTAETPGEGVNESAPKAG
jgi:hypothetical protein